MNLAGAIKRLTSELIFPNNAKAISQAIHHLNGVKHAVEIMERVLQEFQAATAGG